MINADVIKLKRQDFDRRILAVEAATYSKPVACSFTFVQLRDEKVRENIRKWVKSVVGALPGENSVYELTANVPATATALRTAFRPARSLQLAKKAPDRAFSPAVDNAHVPDGGSSLYVGGSRTDKLGTRLCQHLHQVKTGTYALNMRHWVPDDLVGSVTVRVCAILGPKDDILANDIEDALWQSRQPIFGRLGR